MTVKSSISLSDEHHAFARAQVQDGRFSSVSAVVQHGLDLLRQKAEDERLERAALRALDFLVGAVDVEAVLDVVFQSFCLGK